LRRLPVERTTSLEVFEAMIAIPEWFGYASRAPRMAAGHGCRRGCALACRSAGALI